MDAGMRGRRGGRRMLGAVAILAALMAASCGGRPPSGGTSDGGSSPAPEPTNPAPVAAGPYRPLIDPAQFGSVVDNPYFPLQPGARYVYEGVSGNHRERNIVVVTDETKVILGVATTVVHDRVFTDGQLTEDTFDWYAQDLAGNVWYFGEDTKELENGKVVNTSGSWEAGVDGAQPGIAMLGAPKPGESYRQEFYAGEAEDQGKVVALGRSATVPFGSFDDVLVTEDTTPLEPRILEHKFYARGIGLVMEQVLSGAHEVSNLVEFSGA